MEILTRKDILRRRKIIDVISSSVNLPFDEGVKRIKNHIKSELKEGNEILISHLRLCGSIPEIYKHDSREEKLYSKYTDLLISFCYNKMGLESFVIDVRSASADVEAYSKDYYFVADAKAFRLSRTAKNQKDFKIQALDNWKYGKKYAMLVAPVYHLPKRKSQIYNQAIARNVCIFTYSHLAILVNIATLNKEKAYELLKIIFNTLELLVPTDCAITYWKAINEVMINYSNEISDIWRIEKIASVEALELNKKEALEFLSKERERIVNLSKQEAIQELIKLLKIDKKIKNIEKINVNNILDLKQK